MSGSPLLINAAVEALHRWKYEPARLNGKPIATHTQVRINFHLQ
jgi:outer membrane biosynthesis protein TonB